MRVCQFRHDGNLELAMQRRPRPPCQEDLLFYFTGMHQPVKRPRKSHETEDRNSKLEARSPKHYPSFAVIEIFAFNTFDTGHPFSAASAYF
jgi:hypothetical protein